MQSHDLLAPLMQLLQFLIASVFFVHHDLTSAYHESSFFTPPSQYAVCEKCNLPGVTKEKFSAVLFDARATYPLAQEKLLKNDRDALLLKEKSDIRRLMRGKAPMKLDDFFAALVRSYIEKWLDFTQVDYFLRHGLNFLAASGVLRPEYKKIQHQPEYQVDREHILQSIESEETNQLHDLFKAFIRRWEANSFLERSIKKESLDALNEGLLQICSTEGAKLS